MKDVTWRTLAWMEDNFKFSSEGKKDVVVETDSSGPG